MRQLLDTGNLRISWKTYANPSTLFYHEYWIEKDHGYDCFLFIGHLQFRWWVDVSTEAYK